MWTRIQILYISIATILVGAMFFCDFATIIGPEGSEVTIAYREKIPFLILNIMALTAQISALASTKIRFLQMRVCIIAALLLLGFLHPPEGNDFLIHGTLPSIERLP